MDADRHAPAPTRLERIRLWWVLLWAPLWLWWRSRRERVWRRRARLILEETGAPARAKSVRHALQQPAFAERFYRARARAEAERPLTDMGQVRGLVLGVLDEMAVDHRGVAVQFEWNPSAGQLAIYASASPTLAAEALDAAGWRALA